MNHKIYGECVQGYSHKRKNMPCQDSYKILHLSDGVSIVAAADGHGSDECPYSKTGSTIAVNVFCKLMNDLVSVFSENMDHLATYLHREGEIKIAQSMEQEWKRRVWKVHTNNKREKYYLDNGKVNKKAVYKQYGTTVLGLLITPEFVFSLQLGDGDILYADDLEVTHLLIPDKLLGVETHSLSSTDAWRNMISRIQRIEHSTIGSHLYMLSTDGFSNSYETQEDFYQTAREYYKVIKENGMKSIEINLHDWLNETSKFGSGDDITVVLLYSD